MIYILHELDYCNIRDIFSLTTESVDDSLELARREMAVGCGIGGEIETLLFFYELT